MSEMMKCCLFYFQGLAYLHMKGKMHRDIKVTWNFKKLTLNFLVQKNISDKVF